jgi:hypothetical protein
MGCCEVQKDSIGTELPEEPAEHK